MFGHLVIRVVDQHGIELTRGKMWIVNGTNDDVNITDVFTARAIAQLVQRGLADVNSDCAAIRCDGARDWNRKGALSGADVGYERTRLRPEQTEYVGDTVLVLELGTGFLGK